MISTNDVKPGMALAIEGALFSVVDYQHVKPGKGKAFVRMKLKNLETGAVIDRTFRAGESVPRAMINKQDFQFLYKDDLGFHCMNTETYEQMAVPGDLVGDTANFMVEGMMVQLQLYEGNPIGIELAASAELEVTFAEPGVKGDRVSGATKPVTLSTGYIVQAPLFVEQGDVIKIDTRTGDYITRVS